MRLEQVSWHFVAGNEIWIHKSKDRVAEEDPVWAAGASRRLPPPATSFTSLPGSAWLEVKEGYAPKSGAMHNL